ncbi:MAG: hypothetical protein ACI8RZ_003160 [Myxococcota bacterium]|jgi:hypothetical protein
MKQTLIQIIVAVAALAALAAVVYRAQSNAPTPADVTPVATPAITEKPTLTHDPVFLPSTKADISAGLRALDEPGRVGKKDEHMQQVPEGETGGAEPPEINLEDIEVHISDELFLPSTKAGPLVPIRMDDGE